MVDVTITVANANVGPVVKRLKKFKRELADELLEPGEDQTPTFVIIQQIVSTLSSHQDFLKGDK